MYIFAKNLVMYRQCLCVLCAHVSTYSFVVRSSCHSKHTALEILCARVSKPCVHEYLFCCQSLCRILNSDENRCRHDGAGEPWANLTTQTHSHTADKWMVDPAGNRTSTNINIKKYCVQNSNANKSVPKMPLLIEQYFYFLLCTMIINHRKLVI